MLRPAAANHYHASAEPSGEFEPIVAEAQLADVEPSSRRPPRPSRIGRPSGQAGIEGNACSPQHAENATKSFVQPRFVPSAREHLPARSGCFTESIFDFRV
jgi:hypothetical protein